MCGLRGWKTALKVWGRNAHWWVWLDFLILGGAILVLFLAVIGMLYVVDSLLDRSVL